MKTLLTFLLFILLSSCSNNNIEVKNPQKETTEEIKQLAEQDSVTYKAVYLDDTLYLINTKTKLVEKQLRNATGAANNLLLLTLMLGLLILVYKYFE